MNTVLNLLFSLLGLLNESLDEKFEDEIELTVDDKSLNEET